MAAEDRAAVLEIVQNKGEELLRREEEGKTMRLLYESEVRLLTFVSWILGTCRGRRLQHSNPFVRRSLSGLDFFCLVHTSFVFFLMSPAAAAANSSCLFRAEGEEIPHIVRILYMHQDM